VTVWSAASPVFGFETEVSAEATSALWSSAVTLCHDIGLAEINSALWSLLGLSGLNLRPKADTCIEAKRRFCFRPKPSQNVAGLVLGLQSQAQRSTLRSSVTIAFGLHLYRARRRFCFSQNIISIRSYSVCSFSSQVYHDIATHNITDGTGGLDASIFFETNREEVRRVSFSLFSHLPTLTAERRSRHEQHAQRLRNVSK
jgi:hypothetical protein